MYQIELYFNPQAIICQHMFETIMFVTNCSQANQIICLIYNPSIVSQTSDKPKTSKCLFMIQYEHGP